MSNSLSGFEILFVFKTNNLAKLILFSVMVPVLSTQIMVALPSVSTVFICFTTMPIFINLHAPKAINVVKATGISSGNTLIASVNAFSKLSNKLNECK